MMERLGVLTGRLVRLEPLQPADVDQLLPVALEPDLWRWTPSAVSSREDLEAYVRHALEDRDAGRALPLVIRRQPSGEAAGSTRFGALSWEHRRVEIGWTWLAKGLWGTGANIETKLLMLRHAFESWDCIRVELKTDALNERSRRAIVALGATYEGVFRNHIVTSSGRIRDTAWYSITREEWPEVRARLERRLADKVPG